MSPKRSPKHWGPTATMESLTLCILQRGSLLYLEEPSKLSPELLPSPNGIEEDWFSQRAHLISSHLILISLRRLEEMFLVRARNGRKGEKTNSFVHPDFLRWLLVFFKWVWLPVAGNDFFQNTWVRLARENTLVLLWLSSSTMSP